MGVAIVLGRREEVAERRKSLEAIVVVEEEVLYCWLWFQCKSRWCVW